MDSKAIDNKKETPIMIIPVELSKIEISSSNVRKQGVNQDIDELADSIKAVGGLIQPVKVMKKDGDRFELIVGQRRFLAYKKLGWPTIPAIVIDKLDKEDAMIHSLVENVHRAELNHADAAKATTDLYKRFKKDVAIEKVHRITGLSHKRIRQYVEIEEQASAKTKRKLKEGTVEPADVQRVIRAAQGNIEKADEMLEMMKKYQLDTHQKGRLVEYGEDHPTWSASKIVEEAMKPRVEKSVVVPLPPRLRDGLQKAVDACRRNPDEIAAEALEHWLKRNGYL
jgi:ParB family chromosome partitioning protein